MTLSNSGTLTVVGSIYANAFYYNSDIFLKKNIKKLESSLEKIQKLNGYSFDWKKTGKSDIGVIAQEVEKVFPALVGETTDESGEIRKTVQYGNLIAPIIEAIKELASQVKSLHTLIEEQQLEIRKLQTENAELRGRIEAIEKALSTNKQ
ncbi:MAG: tail fiber domain-containing protein [Patescibacteria group bacterium]